MKKSTIWIITGVMGASLLTLLYLQFSYFRSVYDMRKEQFDQAVVRSLAQTAQDLEVYETQLRLDNALGYADSTGEDTVMRSAHPILPPKGSTLRDTIKHYLHRQEIIDQMLSVLYRPSDVPLDQRIDYKRMDRTLKAQLDRNGINLVYHIRVTTSDGREIFRCRDYDERGESDAYSQELFCNDPQPQVGLLYIHFPDQKQYLFYGVRFMIPAIIFTLVVIMLFSITIYTIFRQKRLSEIKNDFINNMTHEFKTPISTISLAAQMLSDPSVGKSEAMFKHLSGVISDETKRLRFQVEKVLQMSMFDKRAATFKKTEVAINALVADVVNTFRLKVESSGGSIRFAPDAADDQVFVDEMHFTNVIFNLMDNAVKYKRDDTPLSLTLTTANKAGNIVLTIADNGIGIRREDLKKIFERFYRVHTGNRHDVKGFGLGLAYVKNVVTNLGGTIHAESEYGKGTTFIISLPTIKR